MGIPGITKFLKTDVWRIRHKDLTPLKAFFLRLLRIILLTFRSFAEDRVQLRASALTFYATLSLVPMIAMAIAVAKGFGLEEGLRKALLERFEGQEEVATWIFNFAQATLENAKGGIFTGVGIAVILYAIIMILSHTENAFNHIWGIKKPRTIPRKISDYLSVILIGPVLLITSSAFTVYVTSNIKLIIQQMSLLGTISPLIFLVLKYVPLLVIWVLFTFLYKFMPNTKVHFRSSLLAGLIAGTMYQIFQWGYITFQIGVTKISAIYGSFAALPLFFIWVHVSWLIVLLGAEISFARQNVDTYEFEKDTLKVSHTFKRLLSLRIVQLLAGHFIEGKRPWTAKEISEEMDMPIGLAHLILSELVSAGVVSSVKGVKEKVVGYQPARDPNTMTVKQIIEMIENHGSDDIPVDRSAELQNISETLQVFSNLVRQSPANKYIKDL